MGIPATDLTFRRRGGTGQGQARREDGAKKKDKKKVKKKKKNAGGGNLIMRKTTRVKFLKSASAVRCFRPCADRINCRVHSRRGKSGGGGGVIAEIQTISSGIV